MNFNNVYKLPQGGPSLHGVFQFESANLLIWHIPKKDKSIMDNIKETFKSKEE